MTTFEVPGPNGKVALEVAPGRPLFIVGRNGTGKSALVHQLYQHGGNEQVSYLPGSRTSIFDAEGLSLTPASRRALTSNLAERQAATMTASVNEQKTLAAGFVADAVSEAIATASKTGAPEHLAGRLAERQIKDELAAKFPKRAELAKAAAGEIVITSKSPYPAELARYQSLVAASDVHGLIARYPVRHSGILNAVAEALKFQSRDDYEAAALTRLSVDEDLRNKLRAKLEPLTSALTA